MEQTDNTQMKTNIATTLNRNMTPTKTRRPILWMAALALGILANTASAAVITLDNSGGQSFAVDSARHFLYAAEGNGPGGTKHLDVINTLTNTVVGNYSYSGSGYSSQVAASGTNAVWADQGDSLARVISVNAAGAATQLRLDGATLATGVSGLSTTYGVSMQGTGDFMKIVNTSTGVQVGSSVNLGGVASTMFSDTGSNLYYAQISGGGVKVINNTASVINSFSGYVMAIDPAAGHHFVYTESASSNQVVFQLDGSTQTATGKSFDFGAGAGVGNLAVDAATGNIWASVQNQNRVVELDSNMNFLQQFSVANASAIAFDNGTAFVSNSGSNTVTTISAVPEPVGVFTGVLCLGFAAMRRRRRNA